MYYLYSISFPNTKRYIGITDNPSRRLATYKSNARKGSTKQKVLTAIRKYGIENLKLQILVIGEKEYIRDLERKAIEAYGTRIHQFGYNQALGGEMSPVAGIGHSLASKAKMSISQKKRIRTPEEIAKMAISLKGRKMSPEHCQKLSSASIQRWAKSGGMPTELKRKVSAARRTGKVSFPDRKMRPDTLILLEKVKRFLEKQLTGAEIATELQISNAYACRLISRCYIEPVIPEKE